MPKFKDSSPLKAVTTLPDITDLRRRLQFLPDEGRILLDDRRMALLHVHSISALRRELIDTLGVGAARGLLTRMGYASGVLDAEMVREVERDHPFRDAFLSGPKLRMLEGVLNMKGLTVDLDVEKGHYAGEFRWTGSIEVDAHLSNYGVSPSPVCWITVGYACGYTTAFLGRPILHREIECCASGAHLCRMIGKPVEEWADELDDLRYLQSETFVNRAPGRTSTRGARGATSRPPREREASTSDQMVGLSSGFNAATHLLQKVADTNAPVLFLGETGVGKELFARNLHAISPRSKEPFVAVNCAAIPENLVEAELFGVQKGAFTGADASRPGRFERADGGTLFLDEIGTLSFAAQGKLLRALQTGEIERVGDSQTRNVDVRVAAATNEDLERKIQQGEFRSDLFYRLNVFPIHIPPLRERQEDLPLLMRNFLDKFSRLHRRNVPGFTERAIRALLDYSYPGNIRELENMIERAVILSSSDAPLDVSLLFPGARQPSVAVTTPAATVEPRPQEIDAMIRDAVRERRISLEALETSVMKAAVDEAKGNLSEAARIIGVTRRRLAYRCKPAAPLSTAR